MDKILIEGKGKTARLFALALADAGFALDLPDIREPASECEGGQDGVHDRAHAWAQTIALAPSTYSMIEKLGLGTRLQARAPDGISDIRGFDVYASNGSHLALGEARASLIRAADLDFVLNEALNGAIGDMKEDKKENKRETKTEQIALRLVSETGEAGEAGESKARALRHDYKASALVAELTLAEPHQQRAVQIFLPTGPLAILPAPEDKSGAHRACCVWSLPTKHANALLNVSEEFFVAALNRALTGAMGIDAIKIVGARARAAQPLSLYMPETLRGERRLLIGEAAHLMHPLAGLGFNRNARDLAALLDVLQDARHLGLDIGGDDALARYEASRRADNAALGGLTHGLYGLFARPIAKDLAALGLSLLDACFADMPEAQKTLVRFANNGLGKDSLFGTRH